MPSTGTSSEKIAASHFGAPASDTLLGPPDRISPAGSFARAEVRRLAPGDSAVKIVVAKARVEFRVRPWAAVFLDGKALGQTPLPAIEALEGKHQVRLVNKDLGKEVTLPLVVRPDQPAVVKYVFGED